jgi:hypothetical protein
MRNRSADDAVAASISRIQFIALTLPGGFFSESQRCFQLPGDLAQTVRKHGPWQVGPSAPEPSPSASTLRSPDHAEDVSNTQQQHRHPDTEKRHRIERTVYPDQSRCPEDDSEEVRNEH